GCRRCRDFFLPFVASFATLRPAGELKFIGELFPDRPVYSVKLMKRIHYAWIVAAVTFVALMGAAGFRATPGVLIVPLEHEFGWNRAIISFARFINLILFGFA